MCQLILLHDYLIIQINKIIEIRLILTKSIEFTISYLNTNFK